MTSEREPTQHEMDWLESGQSPEDQLDIRDFQSGQEYFVITSDERGGRCVMHGMFIAAWETRKAANKVADQLGHRFHVVKTVKP